MLDPLTAVHVDPNQQRLAGRALPGDLPHRALAEVLPAASAQACGLGGAHELRAVVARVSHVSPPPSPAETAGRARAFPAPSIPAHGRRPLALRTPGTGH